VAAFFLLPMQETGSRGSTLQDHSGEFHFMHKTYLATFLAVPLALSAGVLSAGQALAAERLSTADHSFVQAAAAGGLSEVEEAQAAQQKASSSDVKQFAARMISDHTQANEELKQLAHAKGITPPSQPTAAERRADNQLKKLSGASFDREYAKQEVQDHQKTVALFQKEADSGQDPQLKAFAQKYLPTLQEHLKMAQSLSSKG
jgi:putative membrane protein